MEIIFKDKDLEELIAAGKNKHYKKIVKDNVLMNGLIEHIQRFYLPKT